MTSQRFHRSDTAAISNQDMLDSVEPVSPKNFSPFRLNSLKRFRGNADSGISSDTSSETSSISYKAAKCEEKKVPKIILKKIEGKEGSYCIEKVKAQKRKIQLLNRKTLKEGTSSNNTNCTKEIEVIDISMSDEDVEVTNQISNDGGCNSNDLHRAGAVPMKTKSVKKLNNILPSCFSPEDLDRLVGAHNEIINLSELLYTIINCEEVYKKRLSKSKTLSRESATEEKMLSEKDYGQTLQNYGPQFCSSFATLEEILPFNEQSVVFLYPYIVLQVQRNLTKIYPELKLTAEDVKCKILTILEQNEHLSEVFGVLAEQNYLFENNFLCS